MKFLSVRSLGGGSLVSLAASLVLLLVISHATTPSTGGPLGILVMFLLVYVFFTSLALIATEVVSFGLKRFAGREVIDGRRRYYIGSVLGFLPVLYLTLLSMGGASVWGIALIVLFTGLMLFYVLRR